MKTHVRSMTFGGLLSGLLLLAACQSSGYQEVDATSTRMTELRTNVETLKSQVTAAASSLAGVVDNAESDPKTHFEKFAKDAKAVESSYNSAQSRLTKARTSADKLFATWAERAKSITDPELQKASEERRAKLSERLGEVVKVTQTAIDETKAYVTTNSDIVKYLSQDLTPEGIKGVAGKSKDQTKAAEKVNEALDDVVEVVSKAASDFATAKPPPKPAK